MAAPFVSGVVARYLQTLATTPDSFLTGTTAAWTWVSANATTNAITYFDANRSPQTANRLLYVSATLPPLQVTSLVALPTNSGAVVSWEGSISNATYTAVATPGNFSCSTSGGNSCSLMGLTNGTQYSITVTGTNSDGTSPAATTTVIAGLPPEAPATLTAASKNASIALKWSPSATPDATYVVTSSPPSVGCTTTATTCTIARLKNGVNYTFLVTSTTSWGLQSTTPKVVSARPGFVVKRSVVKRGSRTTLATMIVTPSKGRKTWRESGACTISFGRLVAPKKATTCTLKLSVARYRTYPAMSTTLKVTVK
jgi:hypothetical protein